MPRLWPALALTVLALALPGSAAATPTWLPAQQLSAPGMDVEGSATAMAPDGTVIVAWVQIPFNGGFAADRAVVQDLVARVRAPGGSFGPEQIIASGAPSHPQLAIDASGRAVLAWVDGDTVSTAVRPSGGSFGDILSYSGEATSVDSLHLALDSAGNASLLWRAGVAHSVQQVRAGYRPVSGPLALAQTVDSSSPPMGGSDHIQEVRLAGNAAGQDVAVWEHDVHDGSLVASYWGARQAGGGAYSAPVELQQVTDTSTDQLNSDADPAVAPNGDALIAWSRGFGTTHLEARPWPSGGAPGALEDPTNGGGAGTNPDQPVAAFDSSGSGVVGWEAKTGSTFGLQYANRAAGGTYDPAATLDTAASGLLFSPGPGGGLIATWSSDDNTPRAALRAPGNGSFDASHDLAPAGASNVSDGPFAGVDSVGDAAAGWSQPDAAGENNLFVAGFDGAPPMLSGPALASSPVVAGLPVGLGATASDVWSAVSTGWDFGDGATGAGGSVAHAYAKAGDYTARVTSTDAVGNASSATLPVHVIQFLGSFGISRHTFAVGRQATPVSAVKRGTTFRLALGAPATVKIQIARNTHGLRIGKRCRAITRRNRHRKHAKRCTLYVTVRPALTRHGTAGANSYPFSGRIRRKALKPATYRATASAIGSDGVVSRRLVVNFKVVATKPKHHRHS